MKNDPKKPYLSYHTMTLCNNIIVIYGGLISNDNISGDIVFLKYSGKSFTVASYEKNKSGKSKIKNSFSCSKILSFSRLGRK